MSLDNDHIAQTPPVSIAPMMARTDRHYRFMMRQITKHTLLYTEMVTTGAIIHGNRERLLGFDPIEHPISLQVGGDDPVALAECARIAEGYGYDEININVGCPSDRVQNGCFGASLMARPERVAEGVAAMRDACSMPVTVKHRIGIDDIDQYEDMLRFVDIVSEAGPARFTVHARKAWLKGLSPKENRNVPPLRHAEVHQLKRERPDLAIETNGGIKTLDEVSEHLASVDAVMIGRAAYDHPYLFTDVDERFFGDPSVRQTREEVVHAMLPYIAHWCETRDTKLHAISRHMLMLFSYQPGTRAWKRYLSTNPGVVGADGVRVMKAALRTVTDRPDVPSTQGQPPQSRTAHA